MFYAAKLNHWKTIRKKALFRFIVTKKLELLTISNDEFWYLTLINKAVRLGLWKFDLEKFYPEKVEGTIPTIQEIEEKLAAMEM